MARRTINYFKNIRESIINDVKDVADFHARPDKTKEAGFFSIPRNVFCYVDYLGYIAFGYKNGNRTQNTRCAEEFIKKYFPSKYRDYAELIYSMWRHGTVHGYEPTSYFATDSKKKPNKIKVNWLSNNDSEQGNRDAHLNFYPMEGKRATIYLVVNTCQLVDDLLSALDNLVVDLENNSKKKRECEKRLNEFGNPSDFNSIQRSDSKNAVGKQIFIAWQNRSKTKINERGETVE